MFPSYVIFVKVVIMVVGKVIVKKFKQFIEQHLLVVELVVKKKCRCQEVRAANPTAALYRDATTARCRLRAA